MEKGAATADVSKIQGKSALKPCKARSQPLLATISEISSPGSGGTTGCVFCIPRPIKRSPNTLKLLQATVEKVRSERYMLHQLERMHYCLWTK